MENNVKEARIKKGITQRKLSEKLWIGQSTISNIETGKHIPNVDLALQLAQVLECTVEELFSREKS